MNEHFRQPGAYWQVPMGVQPGWPPTGAGQPFPGAAQFQQPPMFYAPVPPTPAHNSPPPTSALPGNPRFIKGALVGAVAAYLLTNETVQQNAIRTAVRAWSMLQGGIEEMKERFRDAEAELHASEAERED
ncbi:hypothetical protein TVNIR_0608 [Thioalkalivibrio nitratireducens DSM 14787]|uniref:YtxH domain-containing protein n=1 Tax=Thioalkalivibrio nitratireducens (strain DSM 14787 / UNIQEM 213 / ALEN2) TaxID=1255043 RepID=L0DRU3_THIND|nr:hypothetical protein [Thioalkalivibrio nitratireducens]AGA32309.1 hypothetical protein TVNIR_0608 [Thioalkalivibrio nitratireducens DSM 14787]